MSSTDTLIVPFSCPRASTIRPPSGVARNAFESRLPTICSTRSPSETITGRLVTLDPVVDRAAPRLVGERLVRALEQLLHVDLFGQDREPVGLELGEIEDVVHQPLQPARLGLHDLE